jgi:signal transduction histidine kinase
MYDLGFVNSATIQKAKLYQIRDQINELIFRDETLSSYTLQNIRNNRNVNKTEYGVLLESQMRNIIKFFNGGLPVELELSISDLQKTTSQIRQLESEINISLDSQNLDSQNSKNLESMKKDYEATWDFNRRSLKTAQAIVEELIVKLQNTISNKINRTRALIILNIFIVLAFIVLQIRKMNTAIQQFIKIQDEKDEAQEHMTIVGELTAGINHEIKNILCVAGLHSNQLSSKLKRKIEITPDEVLKSVQKIETSVGRAEKIIRSVSKLSFDSSHDEKKDCSVYEIFTETQEFAEYFAQKNEVELRIESITPRLKIHCHPIQISQVLLNLVKNSTEAIENLEEKWVNLKAEWKDELKIVIITVSDSGNGIPEKVRNNLFQKQFSTKAPGKGTGLGLSISGKIIVEHGGEIYVDAQATNTTFIVKLPGQMQAPPAGFVADDEAS